MSVTRVKKRMNSCVHESNVIRIPAILPSFVFFSAPSVLENLSRNYSDISTSFLKFPFPVVFVFETTKQTLFQVPVN